MAQETVGGTVAVVATEEAAVATATAVAEAAPGKPRWCQRAQSESQHSGRRCSSRARTHRQCRTPGCCKPSRHPLAPQASTAAAQAICAAPCSS